MSKDAEETNPVSFKGKRKPDSAQSNTLVIMFGSHQAGAAAFG